MGIAKAGKCLLPSAHPLVGCFRRENFLLERIRELGEIRMQFFANVSHELRTLLQLIIGPAERLIQRDATMSPEQREE